MFEWTPEKLEWYARASRRTGFHRGLADRIRPYLRAADTVCDFGCGPGLVDLELAGNVREITAVDIAPAAIAWLRREADETGIENICAQVFDAEKLADADASFPAYDVALFCYFSGSTDLMRAILRRGWRFAVCVMHGGDSDTSNKPSKIGGHFHRLCAADMESFLRAEQIPFETDRFLLDFSQPLRSRDEARAFFTSYAAGEGGTDDVESKVARLVATGDPAYPYLFPCEKDVAFLRIHTG